MIFRYVPLRQWIWHAAAAVKTMFARWRYQRDMKHEAEARSSGVRARYVGTVAANHRRWGYWSCSDLMCRVWRGEV